MNNHVYGYFYRNNVSDASFYSRAAETDNRRPERSQDSRVFCLRPTTNMAACYGGHHQYASWSRRARFGRILQSNRQLNSSPSPSTVTKNGQRGTALYCIDLHKLRTSPIPQFDCPGTRPSGWSVPHNPSPSSRRDLRCRTALFHTRMLAARHMKGLFAYLLLPCQSRFNMHRGVSLCTL